MADQIGVTSGVPVGLSRAQLAPSPLRSTVEKTSRDKVSGSTPQQQSEQSSPDPAASEKTMTLVNNHLEQSGSELKYHVDSETGKSVFKIVSKDTGKVIAQVPSEGLMALARNLKTMDKPTNGSGILFDKEA